MDINSRIFVAGHNGLVGSAIVRQLIGRGYNNIITVGRADLDLVNQSDVNKFFRKEKIDFVILAAAKVGGIHANNLYPADFIYQNLMIQTNVISASHNFKVKRLLFLGSTCIYPKMSNQPIRENDLLSGPLEPTNEPYAVAKIAGIKLCESFNRQYGVDFRSIMPTNLYGINDNFDSVNSHVIPSLIRRFHDAKMSNLNEVEIWGSGKAKREFLYVDDMASAAIFVLSMSKNDYLNNTSPMLSHINVGSGKEISIKELASIIKQKVGFKGKLIFDTSKPDGPPRKLIDSSKLKKMGWNNLTSINAGIAETYKWYFNSFGSK
jgi:GDP-L-fucose synthase